MRLACQVQVSGDVVVHTRVGGPDVKPNQQLGRERRAVASGRIAGRTASRRGAGEEAEEEADET